MSIYISGPITGNPHYRRQFAYAKQELRSAGHLSIYNPAENELELDPHADTWAEYMRRDLEVILDQATGICLLPGWENSRGACIEVDVAKAIGIPVKTTAAWILTPPADIDPWAALDETAHELIEAAGWQPDDDDLHQGDVMQLKVSTYTETPKEPETASAHLTIHADGEVTENACTECDNGWVRLNSGEPFPCARCDAPPPLRLAHREEPATRYTPVVVVPLEPEEENDEKVPTWNVRKGDQIGTIEPAARCLHKWTRVETLPPIKECAECGETRIVHA